MPAPRFLGRLFGRVATDAIGYGVGGALSGAVEPLTQQAANEAWSRLPRRPLDPVTAAQVALEVPSLKGEMEQEAKRSGLNERRFAQLLKAVDNAPDASTLLDLWRRGFITEQAVERGLRDGHVAPEYVGPLKQLRRILLSPQVLASARQQGFVEPERQVRESRLQGLSAEDAEVLFQLAGLPPGPEIGLDMLRRGIIDEETFRRIVREGNTKTKYTDALLALRDRVLSPELAAEAVVRERLSFEEGYAIARKSGVTRQDFELMVNVRGRPMPTGEALRLLRRGELTEDKFREVVARSNVRTEYVDELLRLRRQLPSLLQIRQLVRAGSISDDLAIRYIVQQGYDRELAEAIVDAGKRQKQEKTRDLTLSVILVLYEAREIQEDDAREFLRALGYNSNEVELLLALGDARREIKFREQAVGRVRTLYVSRKISEERAQAILDRIGVHPRAKDDLFLLWDIERESVRATLSMAQVIRAWRRDIISRDEAFERLLGLGYDREDADILLRSYA